MNDALLFKWLSARNFFLIENKIKSSFFVGNALAACSAVRLVSKLEYNLHPLSPRWAGFEFMIGTNNQIATGRIEIEVLEKHYGAVIRRKILEMKDVSDNQVVLVDFDEISDSMDKDYIVRFAYQASGIKSLISIYEANEQESKIKRILRKLGILIQGNILACRLLYVEK